MNKKKLLVDGHEADVLENLGRTLVETLGKNLFSHVVAATVTGEGHSEEVDLSAPVPEWATEIKPILADSPEGLQIIRHSTAHVLATAVKHLFPSAQIAIGPAIENGFYYDFGVEKPFSIEDLPLLEKEMKKIAKARLPFVRQTMSKAEAQAFFAEKGEIYKVALLDGIEGDTVSLYTCGDFVDLCRGPHIPHTGFAKVSKLLSVAGAYWRGDEHNAMLSRIYGTAFANEEALQTYLTRLEEAKRRDHRKLGRDLNLFMFREEATPGMVFWLPRGMLARTILEDFWRKEHLKRGYALVQGPQLLRAEAWKRSGHYDHYRENMYFTRIEEEEYGIKPMNCVGHMEIFKFGSKSYRDLPQRYFELGVVHRHEKSGVLHGLLRVRQFTQDDAHIICTHEQLQDEIAGVLTLINDLMHLFGFRYKALVSTRPENSIGDDADWEQATAALIGAVQAAGLPYTINEGDGAFYGPKIDIVLLDCIGREWQCSTIQADFTLPERFDLKYTNPNGEKQRPVMLHRAIMGSVERFFGIVLEQYAGALPTWLAPEQAIVLTVTEAGNVAAQEMCAELRAGGIRANVDLRNEKLGFKIREAQQAKIPYMLVVGEKEVQAHGMNVRLRNGENLGLKSVAEVLTIIQTDAEEPFRQGGMRYNFA